MIGLIAVLALIGLIALGAHLARFKGEYEDQGL